MKTSMLLHPDEIGIKQIDRLADAGVSVLGIHPVGGTKAVESLNDLLLKLKDPDFKRILDYSISKGLEIEYEFHAAGHLLPRNLFKKNPELFRMDEQGKRASDYNFCVSNPETLKIVSERGAELAELLYGNNNKFFFWMDDGKKAFCHCPKCKRLTPSDQQTMALNAILSKIKQKRPNAKMAYLAYFEAVSPPVNVQPQKDVFLEYAPFEKYTATGENAKDVIEKEQAMLTPLLEFFGAENSRVLEYWYDNSLYSKWKKPPEKFKLDENRLNCDVAYYKAKGFSHISTFACYLGDDYEALHGEVDITPFTKAVNML